MTKTFDDKLERIYSRWSQVLSRRMVGYFFLQCLILFEILKTYKHFLQNDFFQLHFLFKILSL